MEGNLFLFFFNIIIIYSLIIKFSKLITGSYHNIFYSYDWQNDIVTTIEANKTYPTSKIKTVPFAQRNKDLNADTLDYNKKCLHMAYHPNQDLIAVGASNNLFLYEGIPEND